MRNFQTVMLTIIMYLFGFLIGFAMGNDSATNRMQKNAIEAGVAEWKINAKTGGRTFEYKKF
jgi:hypothetical protein